MPKSNIASFFQSRERVVGLAAAAAPVYTRRLDGGEGEAVVGRITAGIVRERDVRLFGPHGLLVEAEESVKDLGAWFLFTRMEGRNAASGGGAAWVANGNRGPESRRARQGKTWSGRPWWSAGPFASRGRPAGAGGRSRLDVVQDDGAAAPPTSITV
ncbi:hypothetical protein [Streptomyces solaniscabiei]|uniref:hypothetical protein n=1 Tax=Streptomyces solaniscabiei TaxID=2683255 RepID=UPI001CE35942|nr:hypothetical protein [Streptomyces solaniscabiei]